MKVVDKVSKSIFHADDIQHTGSHIKAFRHGKLLATIRKEQADIIFNIKDIPTDESHN